MKEDQDVVKDSIFRIGRVTSVDGRTVTIEVDKTKNSSHLAYQGNFVKNVSVGSFLKIQKGFIKIICKVDGEFTREDSHFSTKSYTNEINKINRSLRVSLLGFFEGLVFKRGIREMPLIDNECHLLDWDEYYAIHRFVKPDAATIQVGHLSLDREQKIEVGIDSLFASHIGIFGNTGSGKSYTLAKIYHELFRKYKDSPKFVENAKFVIVDFNGEYISDSNPIIVEEKYKHTYRLSTRKERDKFPIPSKILQDEAFWRVILDATEKTQTPFLGRALRNKKLPELMSNPDAISTSIQDMIVNIIAKNDKELGFRALTEYLWDMNSCFPDSNIPNILYELRDKVSYHNKSQEFYVPNSGLSASGFHPTNNPKFVQDYVRKIVEKIKVQTEKIELLQILKIQILFQYYEEIVRGYENREHLAPMIKRMENRFVELTKIILPVEDGGLPTQKNIIIVSLKDVNIEMKKLFPLILCKDLYETQKSKEGENSYLNLIIDEAHNILSESSERENEDVRDYRLETFEEIIKEGRKFGVFLTIASQRPADISPTIISQLHNFFLHRLINDRDISAVERTISYLDKLSFEYLPILPTGTCILAGLSADMPIIVDIEAIDKLYEPDNKTRELVKNWT